jgi:hypothetical protein
VIEPSKEDGNKKKREKKKRKKDRGPRYLIEAKKKG